LRRVAGLDGLRGVAVFAILLYHGGFSWLPGGFLGVSTFFTLSGFLIASLVVVEMDRTEHLGMRSFWSRRARRVLPAALLTLLGIVVFHQAFGAISVARLRGDLVAALAYVENWWLIHTNQSYGDIFGAASPVQHFWSLAIEEQYYLVFPLACVLLTKLVRRRRLITIVFALAALASVLWGAFLTSHVSVSRLYYGTDTRAAEILIGVVVAFALAGYEWGSSPTARRVVNAVGLAAFAVLLLLWWRTTFNGSDLFRGVTALNAICTAVVIVACVHNGWIGRLLGIAPLRLLGIISYGVYLIHWPVYLWLSPQRVHIGIVQLFVLRLVVTLAIAIPMFVLVERPILRRRVFPKAQFAGVAIAASILVLVLTLTLPKPAHPALDLNSSSPVAPQIEALQKHAHDPRPHVLVVGDSLGWTVFAGLEPWGQSHGLDVERFTAVGCGIGGVGELRYLGVVQKTLPDCGDWHTSLRNAVRIFRPDVTLVVMGLADLSPRKDAHGKFESIGEPKFDSMLTAKTTTMMHVLGATGGKVLWATYPHVRVPYQAGATGRPPFVENDRARVDTLNALVERLVPTVPNAQIVRFAEYGRARKGGEFDPDYRPDGVHLDTTGAGEVSKWLGPQIIAATR
jgi:peptidoglycan/LPS O-acetylase OafA/YrhL